MDAFLKVIADTFKEGLATHQDAYDFLRNEFVSTIQNKPSKKATMLAVMGKKQILNSGKLTNLKLHLVI